MAVGEHLEENDCHHSLKEIFRSIIENKEDGWKASEANPTTSSGSWF
jgi:hypothetical protein